MHVKKLWYLAPLTALMLAVAGCPAPLDPGVPVTGISLNKAQTSLLEGSDEQLVATLTPPGATNRNVIWNTTNPAVAAIDTDGRITADAVGTAVIIATAADGGHTAFCAVIVSDTPVAVTGVTLNKPATVIGPGGNEQLAAFVVPANATNQAVTWSSSDDAVAGVSDTGLVTAASAGTADITATTADGGLTASCAVTVSASAVAVTGISLNTSSLSLETGLTAQLTATVIPSNATNQSVTWSSSAPATAAVSAAGLVTALAPGGAIVTVATADGGFTASCAVTVTATPVPVSGVSLNASATTLVLGTQAQLTATVLPLNATNQAVVWASYDTTKVIVSAYGHITAVGAGNAVVTATTVDGGYTASCTVTVSAIVPVTGVTLSASTLLLAEGGAAQLTASVLPANATNQSVSWSSSNPAAAAVSAAGLVSGTAAGTAVITAVTADGGYGASCAVTVSAAGTRLAYNAAGVSFTMVFVPRKTFYSTGNDMDTATVPDSFWLCESEVTYAVWNAVYAWATDAARGSARYYFAHPGRQGGSLVDPGPIGNAQHPVTTVNWRDALVWCNAATEWYNAQTGSAFQCVYVYNGAVIRDAQDTNAAMCDSAAALPGATGFRLPTDLEWMLAARYKGDLNNDGDITDTNEYYPADWASGAASSSLSATRAVGWCASNSSSSSREVKTRIANALGIYDISGNALEWCFGYPSPGSPARWLKGGCMADDEVLLHVGFPYQCQEAGNGWYVHGFRIARSLP